MVPSKPTEGPPKTHRGYLCLCTLARTCTLVHGLPRSEVCAPEHAPPARAAAWMHPLMHTRLGFLFPCTPTHANSSPAYPTMHAPCLQAPPDPPTPAEQSAPGWQAALPSLAQPVPTALGCREWLWAPHGSQHLPCVPSCGVTPVPSDAFWEAATATSPIKSQGPSPVRCGWISGGARRLAPAVYGPAQRPQINAEPRFICFWSYKGELTQLRLCNRSPCCQVQGGGDGQGPVGPQDTVPIPRRAGERPREPGLLFSRAFCGR